MKSKKEPKLKKEFLKKFEKVRKSKSIHIGSLEDFEKRYNIKPEADKIFETCPRQKRKAFIYTLINNIRMFPSDLIMGSLDELFHDLSPRYLFRDMPGFIFTSSWRQL